MLTCEELKSAEVNTTIIPRFLSNYERYPPASGLRSPRSEDVERYVSDIMRLRQLRATSVKPLPTAMLLMLSVFTNESRILLHRFNAA
jgi:hypothetical protein